MLLALLAAPSRAVLRSILLPQGTSNAPSCAESNMRRGISRVTSHLQTSDQACAVRLNSSSSGLISLFLPIGFILPIHTNPCCAGMTRIVKASQARTVQENKMPKFKQCFIGSGKKTCRCPDIISLQERREIEKKCTRRESKRMSRINVTHTPNNEPPEVI